MIRDSTAHFAFDAARTTIIGFNVFGQYWLLPGHYMRGEVIKESRKVTLRRASAIRTGMGNHTQAFEYSSVTGGIFQMKILKHLPVENLHIFVGL